MNEPLVARLKTAQPLETQTIANPPGSAVYAPKCASSGVRFARARKRPARPKTSPTLQGELGGRTNYVPGCADFSRTVLADRRK
jgi:hypothetical protein